MIDRVSGEDRVEIDEVSAPDGGQAIGVNYGTVSQRHLHGSFQRLRDVIIDLDPLPGDMGLVDPIDPKNRLGSFTGRGWLIDRIDAFIAEQLTHRRSAYLLIEAEAGMGKSALATYLAFKRGWPTHVTRLVGDSSPEAARTNLVAQVIARWNLADAAPDGVLPHGHETTSWLYGRLCEAARRRDETEPTTPLVLLVDGLDEAPPPTPGQLPLGLPPHLPPGTVVVATSRPGTYLPAGIKVERIDVESQLNHDDLLEHLRYITARDPRLAKPLATVAMDREYFCRTLLDRSGGVWIYAVSVLDQIRDDHRSPAEVDALPPGLAAYYTNNVTRWQADPALRWNDAGLPVLATVAAAREPQPAGVLARWAGVLTSAAKGLLRGPFKAFLVVRPGGDPDVYAVRHQSLRELCEGQLPENTDDNRLRELAYDLAEATRDAQERIVTALVPPGDPATRDWGEVDGYAQLHLPEHAARCGRLDELVCDPEFLLVAGVPELLRLRRHLITEHGRAAAAALELASNSWSYEHDHWLRWLVASGRKVKAEILADAAMERLDPGWHPRAAMWSGTSHRMMTGHTGGVTAVAAVSLPDGRTLLASAGDDRTVRLWDPATGTAVGPPLTGHTGGVTAVAAVSLPDGRTLLASTSSDGTVRLWDPATGTALGPPLTGHTGGVRAVAAVPLPDGRTLLASAGSDGTVRLWDPATGTAVGPPLTGHTDWVRAVAAVPLPDGRTLLASAGDDDTVRLWDPATGTALGPPLTGHTGRVRAVAAVPLPDGRTLLASAGDDDTVRLWDPATGTAVGPPLTGHTGWVTAVAAVPLPDRRTLLASAGDDDTVRLWDPATGTAVGPPLTGHTGGVRAVAAVLLPDRRTLLASAGSDGTVRLWDPATGTAVGPPLTGHTGGVRAVAAVLLPDRRTLLASAGSDGTVQLWDPATGTAVGPPLTGHTGGVTAVAAVPLPDGRTLLASAGDDGTVQLWDPATGTAVGPPLTSHVGGVTAVAAVPLPDGRTLLASAGDDGTVRLWDPATRTAVGRPLISHHVGGVAAVPLPDGRILLASAGDDGTVRLWDPATGTAVGPPLTSHVGGVTAVAAVPLPDGRTLLASAGDDGTVRLWDPATGFELHVVSEGTAVGSPLTGHTGPVRAVAAVPLPDGRTLLASAGDDHMVRLWDLATTVGTPLTGHTGRVRAVAAVPLPDGRTLLASAGDDQAIIIWEHRHLC